MFSSALRRALAPRLSTFSESHAQTPSLAARSLRVDSFLKPMRRAKHTNTFHAGAGPRAGARTCGFLGNSFPAHPSLWQCLASRPSACAQDYCASRTERHSSTTSKACRQQQQNNQQKKLVSEKREPDGEADFEFKKSVRAAQAAQVNLAAKLSRIESNQEEQA